MKQYLVGAAVAVALSILVFTFGSGSQSPTRAGCPAPKAMLL